MKLSELLYGVNVKNDYKDCEIKDISTNTKDDLGGKIFVCIKGKRFDPHDIAKDIIEKGAGAVVVERDLGVEGQIVVENTRSALALICANFFGNPSKKLKLIGVTGTNGKTTTAYLIRTILRKLGHRTGLIGSVENIIGEESVAKSTFTTPEPYELHSLFKRMLEAGCEYCVMEVSSQALSQYRVCGCEFEQGIFTNLTNEHLDYHGTMENYLEAKKELFKISKTAIINTDDEWAHKIVEGLPCRVVSFAIEDNSADYVAKNVKLKRDGVEYETVGNGVIARAKVPYPGDFSVYNSLGAAVSAVELGYNFKECVEALSFAQGIKGRMEIVPTDTDYTVIIDYAHTPDGLTKVLNCVRAFAPGRLVCVFGCSGERDREKRPIMGRIVASLTDFFVVTTDNPRNEGSEIIIEDVLAGLKDVRTPHVTIYKREDAVRFALKHARKDDIIICTGKGHEDYQITKEGKFHFSEREVILDYLSEQRAKSTNKK